MGVKILDAIILTVAVTVNAAMFAASVRVHGAIAVKPSISITGLGK
jgi:hypothetical protein